MIRLACFFGCFLFFAPIARAGGGDALWSGFSASFDYVDSIDMRVFSNPMVGSLQSQLATLGYFYRQPGGAQFDIYGGTDLQGKLVDVAGVTTQTFNFAVSPVFGLSAGYDLVSGSPFHLVPALGWRHASYTGTSGSLTGACTYDFSTNAANACVTVGGVTGAQTLSSVMDADTFSATVEMAMDFGDPSTQMLTLYAGAGEILTTVAGTVTYTLAGGTLASENHNYSSARPLGFYTGIRFRFGSFGLEGRAAALAETMYSVNMSLSM